MSSSSSRPLSAAPTKIAITTGDIDGIGSEITAKALAKLKPKPNTLFYLWRSTRCPQKHLRLIDSQFKRVTVKTWPEALNHTPGSSKEIVDICSNLPPPAWVEVSAKASLFGHIDAITTAPLSKKTILKAGIQQIGHTEILRKITKSPDLFMGFIGSEFNVLLATPHIPIKDVSRKLTSELIEKAIRSANEMRKLLPGARKNKPLAILGLNPHAGEDGIIGLEEIDNYKSALEKVRKGRIPIEGPLVPDAAFFKSNWKKYSVYVCPFHDQGLIPFKMIHQQDSGIQVTMGLPFIRTSVDHGTAKDLFGRNKANPNSMYEAINWAMKLCQHRRTKK